MLRTTLSKIKKVCTIAIVPRILQGEAKYVQKKFTKHSLATSRATKSTSSGNASSKHDKESKSPAEHQRIHIMEKTNESVTKSATQTPEDSCEICNRIINKIFEPESASLEAARVNATNKNDTEELAQKMEKLEEAPVVLTPSRFEEQPAPRVLGNQHVLNTSNKKEPLETNTYDTSFDEIARRCLNVPPNEVDDYIVKELRQYYKQSRGNVYEIPTEKYFSQAVYNPQHIIHLGKVNSNTGAAIDGDQNFSQNLKVEENILHIYTTEIIQPLLLDSMSMYGEDTGLTEEMLERPNFETPLVLNPYDNNLIFPLDDYFLRDELLIEAPKLEETMTVTEAVQDSEVGNNEAMPPAEMEVETDQPGVRERLPGTVAGVSLGVPEDITASESQHTTEITGIKDRAYVYTHHSHQPPTEPPPDWQTQIGQHNERQPVIPNTSISGKPPETERRRRQQIPDSAISSHQNLHDLYIIGINRDMAEVQETRREVSDSNVLLSSKDSESKDNPSFVRKDPITYVSFEPESLEKSKVKPENSTKPEPKEIKNTEGAQQSRESEIATATGPIPDVAQETNIPLKEMLRRIRERNRQEICRDFFQQATQVQLSTACKPKTPFPGPCKPIPIEKPKSECPPPPKCPEKKDPCAPKDKDPCAKFMHLQNQFYNSIYFIRLSLFNNIGNTRAQPIINYQSYKQYSQVSSASTLHVHSLNDTLKDDPFEDIGVKNVDVILARDYEPWTPIPSWPLPKEDKKRKVVCPKDGCKLLPPPPLNPAEKDKPCVSFPKKTFSLTELFEHQPVTSA